MRSNRGLAVDDICNAGKAGLHKELASIVQQLQDAGGMGVPGTLSAAGCSALQVCLLMLCVCPAVAQAKTLTCLARSWTIPA